MLRTSDPTQYSQYTAFPPSPTLRPSKPLRTLTSPFTSSKRFLSSRKNEPDNASDSSHEQPPPPTVFTPTQSESTRYSAESSRTVSAESPQLSSTQSTQQHLSLSVKDKAPDGSRSSASSKASATRPASKENAPPQTSLANLAMTLRPDLRWSQESSYSLEDSKDAENQQRHSFLPSPSIDDRHHTALDLEDPGFLAAITASPIIRPATSAQDYSEPQPLPNDTHQTPTAESPSKESLSTRITSDSVPQRVRPVLDPDALARARAESVRSAATNVSSVPDLISNGHTSTWTDRSSVSEAAQNPLNPSLEEDDDELTVEDCIAMYAQGFHDDPPISEIPVIPEEQPLKLPDTTNIPEVPPLPDQSKPPKSPLSASHLKSPSTASNLSSSDSRSIRTETTVDPSVESPMLDKDSPPPPLPPPPHFLPDYPEPFARNLLGPKKPARDQYGFKKESQHVRMDDYNDWEPKYKQYLERRRRKWVHLMNETGFLSVNPEKFPPRSDKVKRYVRKGIPPQWRGAAWYHYADGESYIAANPGLYRRLVTEADEGRVSENDADLIERDLHRTLPENKHFKPDTGNGTAVSPVAASPSSTESDAAENAMIKSLRNLLRAFAVHHPNIGYCQSLNFLAAHLLLFMRSAFPDYDYEERAFALLCILTETYLPGTHGLVLEGANVDIGVLMMLIQEGMPNLWSKLDDKSEPGGAGSPAISRQGTSGLPSVSLATTAWFMSCFVSTLPIETTCRVWDCMWYEGSKTIFRVALAIFKLGERDIRKTKDPMEMFQVIQNLPRSLLDANLLMDIATKKRKVPGSDTVSSRIGPGVGGFGGLSQKTVERLREERRALCRREQERTGSIVQPMVPPPVPEETSTLNRSLSRSSSRARLKRLKSVRKLLGDKS